MRPMQLALKLHPHSRCPAVTRIGVGAVRLSAGRLVLHYVVTGAISKIRLPSAAAPARSDELWRHTCFEAFARAQNGSAYYEFNFAPQAAWAAYRFDFYRKGMRAATEVGVPRIETRSSSGAFELLASLELDRAADLPKDAPWRLGLSAVVEETSGHLSYWALTHPKGKADFHHSACFALEIP